jgi:hypothetical protein
MKKTVILSLCSFATLLAFQTVNAQTTIAQWTFENTANTNGMNFVPGANNSPGTFQADNGLNYSGSVASGLHPTAATYSWPAGDLDPIIAALAPGASGPGLPGSSAANASPSLHSFSANNWSVGAYWSFTTSTLGYTGVEIAFDQAGSGTGPANFGLSYSINGGAFTEFTTYTVPLSTGWNTTTANQLSEVVPGGGAFDNANSIVFRLTDLNTTSVGGGTVGTTGTDRVDNFTVVSVPEPTALALAGLGGLSLMLFRRQRK